MSLLASALLLFSGFLGDAPPQKATFVIVVANNDPAPGPGDLEPLRFADDDGARYHELFNLVAEENLLFSVLDAETQTLHPGVAEAARPPRRARILAGLTSMFDEIRAAKAAGRVTTFYFVFVGHGSVDGGGEGVVHFADGVFSRSELFERVIEPSPADYNHILIDACNAFLLVAGRGERDLGAAIDSAVDRFLTRERMDAYPNTGFILSTSAAEEVHEWSGFRAGVFSHEVRSALLGGADVDGDGIVTYAELQAFLQAANGKVKDPRAKLRPWVSAPRILARAALFDRSWLQRRVTTVEVPDSMHGRWSLEDDRGVRVADVHTAADGPVTLVLPTKRPHFLRSGEDDRELRIDGLEGRVVDAGQLPVEPRPTRPRSAAAAESYRRHLFAIPFGLAFFEGFRLAEAPVASVLAERAPEAPDRTGRHWVAGALLVASLGAVASGLVLGQLAEDRADDFRRWTGPPDDLERIASEARDQETAANVLFGASAALAAGGFLLLSF